MKYRIVKDQLGYYVQRRIFGIWILEIVDCWDGDRVYFDTIEKAQAKALEMSKLKTKNIVFESF